MVFVGVVVGALMTARRARSCLSKQFFLKVCVSLCGLDPSVAHGKLSVRGRCV